MKQVVEGNMFIVPNASEAIGSFSQPEWQMEKLRRLLGLKVNYEEKVVQVWMYDQVCDNWNDQFGGFQKTAEVDFNSDIVSPTTNERLLGYFPRYIPAKLLEDKKEGDVVEFDCPEYGVKIKLTCKQMESRYRRFGKFEEVFQYVL